MFAEVIIDIAHAKIDRVFSYRVPEDMQLCIGNFLSCSFRRGQPPEGRLCRLFLRANPL